MTRKYSFSQFPIVENSWYEGIWYSNAFDYVVYPAGIVLSDDGKTVHVSFGYQNARFSELQFNVDELFDSLQVIEESRKISDNQSIL